MSGIDIGFTQGPKQVQSSRGLFACESPQANFTIGGSSLIKWKPGHYGVVYTPLHRYSGGTSPFSAYNIISPYVGTGANTGVQYSGVTGIALNAWWGYLESDTTQGVYNFGGNTSLAGTTPDIDQILSFCASNGKYFRLMLCLNGQWGASGSDAGNYLPNYMLGNSIYGAPDPGSSGLTGGGYGIAAGVGGGAVPNLTNANVVSVLQDLIGALATAYDSNPYFETFSIISTDTIGGYAGTALGSGSTFYTAIQSLYTYAKSVFLHTNVQVENGFGGIGQSNLTQWCFQNGILVGCSDTAGNTAFQNTYLTLPIGSIGSTSLTLSGNSWATSGGNWTANNNSATLNVRFNDGETRVVNFTYGSPTGTWTGALSGSPTTATCSYMPGLASQAIMVAFNMGGAGNNNWVPISPAPMTYSSLSMDIEPLDITGGSGLAYPTYFTPSDVCTAINNQYNAGHVYWWMMGGGYGPDGGITSADWATSVIPAIQANPIVNTAYPSIY